MVPMAVAVLHKVRFKSFEGIAMHTLAMAAQSSQTQSFSAPESQSPLSVASKSPKTPRNEEIQESPKQQMLHEAVIPLRSDDVLQINGLDLGRRKDQVSHAFVALPSGGEESPRIEFDDDVEHDSSDVDSFAEEVGEHEEETEELEKGGIASGKKKSKKTRRIMGKLADMDDPVSQYCRAVGFLSTKIVIFSCKN